MFRRSALPAAILAALLWAATLAAPATTLGAAPDLQIVSDTTYLVRPADRLVHVVVDGQATSFKADTATQRYYYSSVVVVVISGAINFAASAAGAPATVTVVEQDEQQLAVRVALNRSVFYRQTATFRLEFDLASGAASGDVRVGANVAALPVWAVGSAETPGSTVAISVPANFQIDVSGAEPPEPVAQPDGSQLYRWGPLDDPIAFFPYVVADNPVVTEGTFSDLSTTVQIAGEQVAITVKAWADDPAWGQRVSDRITAGMPVLSGLIGLPYIGTDELIVRETVPRTIGGYAGIFDASVVRDEISISYDADEGVTLHEAAHAWFNGQLASERWILEGFASYYAELAAGRLGVAPGQIELTPDLRAARFPLEEWGNPGLTERNAELYAYGASLQAARDLASRAGADGLSSAWAAMLDSQMAYQPLHAASPETWFARGDWHYLLDLLEEGTGKPFRDVFETWVAAPADAELLDQRDAARDQYHALRDQAGSWDLPRDLRRDMSAWAFDEAVQTMDDAAALLDRRDQIAQQAAALGLTLPDTMQRDFAGGRLNQAAADATDMGAAVQAYADALAANDGIDPIEWLGLLGEDPAATLARAASSLADGATGEATEQAANARETWQNAAQVGTGRAVAVGGGFVLLAGAGLGGGVWWRRRRRLARLASDPGDVLETLDQGEDL
jgi:hypothetical protein